MKKSLVLFLSFSIISQSMALSYNPWVHIKKLKKYNTRENRKLITNVLQIVAGGLTTSIGVFAMAEGPKQLKIIAEKKDDLYSMQASLDEDRKMVKIAKEHAPLLDKWKKSIDTVRKALATLKKMRITIDGSDEMVTILSNCNTQEVNGHIKKFEERINRGDLKVKDEIENLDRITTDLETWSRPLGITLISMGLFNIYSGILGLKEIFWDKKKTQDETKSAVAKSSASTSSNPL